MQILDHIHVPRTDWPRKKYTEDSLCCSLQLEMLELEEERSWHLYSLRWERGSHSTKRKFRMVSQEEMDSIRAIKFIIEVNSCNYHIIDI